jgi:NAD(P)H dehydrogenase (quinone)
MLHQPPESQARHVVVLCHPDSDSFNASVAETYCRSAQECGHDAVLRDLYAMHFDPILRQDERPGRRPFLPSPDVEDELNMIQGGDVFVFVYPIWFGTPPAMLKGYVDRVLGAGVTARAVQDRAWHNLLGGKRLVSFTSSAAREPWLAEQGQSLSLQTVFDDYLARAFAMQPAEHIHFGGIVDGLPPRFVAEHLTMVRERARRICAVLTSERHHPPQPAAH